MDYNTFIPFSFYDMHGVLTCINLARVDRINISDTCVRYYLQGFDRELVAEIRLCDMLVIESKLKAISSKIINGH